MAQGRELCSKIGSPGVQFLLCTQIFSFSVAHDKMSDKILFSKELAKNFPSFWSSTGMQIFKAKLKNWKHKVFVFSWHHLRDAFYTHVRPEFILLKSSCSQKWYYQTDIKMLSHKKRVFLYLIVWKFSWSRFHFEEVIILVWNFKKWIFSDDRLFMRFAREKKMLWLIWKW